MVDTYSVALADLVKEFDLIVEFASTDYDSIRLTVEDVSRPGIQLSGYFDHFEPMRLQVVGNVEISYLEKLTEAERVMTLGRFYSYKIPALLVTRNKPLEPVCLEMAQKHNVTLLRSKEATSTIVSAIITYLKSALAPRITRHAVLMEIYDLDVTRKEVDDQIAVYYKGKDADTIELSRLKALLKYYQKTKKAKEN